MLAQAGRVGPLVELRIYLNLSLPELEIARGLTRGLLVLEIAVARAVSITINHNWIPFLLEKPGGVSCGKTITCSLPWSGLRVCIGGPCRPHRARQCMLGFGARDDIRRMISPRLCVPVFARMD